MRRAIILAASIWAVSGAEAVERTAPASPRRTETVRVVENCLPSVAAIRCFRQQDQAVFTVTAGSGSVVHASGYILTNDHVVGHAQGGDVMLPGSAPAPFRVVARLPHEDMAMIKIEAPTPLRAMPLGRSHDLMLGEPTIVIGNPDGIADTVSTGIISGLGRSIATQDAFLGHLVQTNAAVSGGSSGGPLINALGQQIGMITGKRPNAENLNFAITIDHVRNSFPHLIAAEVRGGFRFGIDVDMLALAARIVTVAPGSPAADAGLRVGDVVRRIDGLDIAHGIDFHIALLDRKAGQTIRMVVSRDDREAAIAVPLGEFPLPRVVDESGMAGGVDYAVYEGRWDRLPDFAALEPARTGRADRVSLDACGPLTTNFAARFTGYVRIPVDGLYTFSVSSDDGSRLSIGDRLVVDNDGLHGMREASGLARLRAGLNPLAVSFFQADGEQILAIAIEGPNMPKQELTADFLFTSKDPIAPRR